VATMMGEAMAMTTRKTIALALLGALWSGAAFAQQTDNFYRRDDGAEVDRNQSGLNVPPPSSSGLNTDADRDAAARAQSQCNPCYNGAGGPGQ
jgi:hypothetical protein